MDLLSSLPYVALLNPVGRLDKETAGLLLLTDDGELAHRLAHPSYEVKKTYQVTTNQRPTAQQLRSLRRGFVLDGQMTAPAEAELLAADDSETPKGRSAGGDRQDCGSHQSYTVRFTIHEGRKRQIRRMFKRLGLPVLNLRRTAIGPILLGNLPEGAFRTLNEQEIRALKEPVGLS